MTEAKLITLNNKGLLNTALSFSQLRLEGIDLFFYKQNKIQGNMLHFDHTAMCFTCQGRIWCACLCLHLEIGSPSKKSKGSLSASVLSF